MAGGRGERMEVYSISILSCSSYPLAISSGISPSHLIELVVYTYTTRNDSNVGKKGACAPSSFHSVFLLFSLSLSLSLSVCLSFSLSLSLSLFRARFLPCYLNIQRGIEVEDARRDNWTRLNKMISSTIPDSNEALLPLEMGNLNRRRREPAR